MCGRVAKASSKPDDRAAAALTLVFERHRARVREVLASAALVRSLSPSDVATLRQSGAWQEAILRANREAEAALSKLVLDSGAKGSAMVGAGRFTLDNPYTPQWIRQHAGSMITNLSDSGLHSLRAYLDAAVQLGIPPNRMANTIAEIAGLREDQTEAIAKYQLSLASAGRDWGEIDRLTAARAKRAAAQRARLIARTETTTAQAMGLDHSWRVAQNEGVLGRYAAKEWVAAVGSVRTTEICLALDGQTVPLGSHFFSTVLGSRVYAPAAHPNCRSTMIIRELSRDEWEALPRY